MKQKVRKLRLIKKEESIKISNDNLQNLCSTLKNNVSFSCLAIILFSKSSNMIDAISATPLFDLDKFKNFINTYFIATSINESSYKYDEYFLIDAFKRMLGEDNATHLNSKYIENTTIIIEDNICEIRFVTNVKKMKEYAVFETADIYIDSSFSPKNIFVIKLNLGDFDRYLDDYICFIILNDMDSHVNLDEIKRSRVFSSMISLPIYGVTSGLNKIFSHNAHSHNTSSYNATDDSHLLTEDAVDLELEIPLDQIDFEKDNVSSDKWVCNVAYFNSNKLDLINKYRNQYVAIYDSDVKYNSKYRGDVLKWIKNAFSNVYDRKSVYIEYLDEEEIEQ